MSERFQSFLPVTAGRRCARRFLFRFLAGMGAAALASGIVPASEPDDDFTDLSLEELNAVSLSAASKHAHPLFETPAAVTVLLPVDVSRAGAATMADAVRLIPGVHVTDMLPHRHSIAVRGGNGIQSTKLLVLVDGRSVYGPFYGMVEWSNAQVDVTDLARVEVVRGPGATLWGANAVNGIINVISKDARETQGGVLSTRLGTAEAAEARVRYGGRLSENTWYRVYTSAANTEGAAGGLADDPLAGYKEVRTGFRTDTFLGKNNQFTTQGDYLESARVYRGNKSTHRTHSLLTRLNVRETEAGDLQLQFYVDRTVDTAGQSDQGGQNSLPFTMDGDGYNLDLDVTHHLRVIGRHDLIWGGGLRYGSDRVDSSSSMRVNNPELKSWLFNLFVQDEITIVPDTLRFTVGSKLEHHPTIDWEVLPNVRATWLPAKNHAFWAAASRAARAPSRGEREVNLTLASIPATPMSPPLRVDLSGNSDLQAEINTAYEAGWRWRPNARFQTDATAYYFDYSKVRSLAGSVGVEPGMPPTVVQRYVVGNDSSATTTGVEVSWQYRVSDRWELGGAVARADAETKNPAPNPIVDADYAIPTWLWNLRSWWQLPRDFEFSVTVYGAHDMQVSDQKDYVRLDLQLLWRPRPQIEISLGVQNAADPRHPESVTGDLIPNMETRRNVYARVQWRF